MAVPAGGTLPDVLKAVMGHLTAAFPSLNVNHRVTSPWPCLRVVRSGGSPVDPRRIDQALIQLEAWGAPDDESSTTQVALAAQLANVVASCVWDLRGSTVGACKVGHVEVVTHALWSPDTATNQPRYLSRLLLNARPA
jgi:hypothetical protein